MNMFCGLASGTQGFEIRSWDQRPVFLVLQFGLKVFVLLLGFCTYGEATAHSFAENSSVWCALSEILLPSISQNYAILASTLKSI